MRGLQARLQAQWRHDASKCLLFGGGDSLKRKDVPLVFLQNPQTRGARKQRRATPHGGLLVV